MSDVAEGDAGPRSNTVILHLVGGDYGLGGLMSFVREITREPLPGFNQFVWKYRKYPPENITTVSRGWSKSADRTVVKDIMGAALDLIPLIFWLRRHRPFMIMAHTRMATILSALLAVMFPIPVIVYVHAQKRKTSFYRFLWRASRAMVVFNSRATCLHYDYALDKAQIVSPPIQWPGPPQAGGRRFVVSSQIVRLKNIHIIIAAFLAMEKHSQSLHIYGFSSNVPEPDYQEEIARLAKPHPNIHLHPWDPHWVDSLCEGDIFVHAAVGEAFGIVMLEAYAKGCRMIVPKDTFIDDLPCAGVFQSAPDSGDLSQAMTKAMAFSCSNDLWRLREPVSDRFSVQTARKTLSEIYRSRMQPS